MPFADPNLYDFWPYEDRPKIVWPDGKKLAFWIAPNIEYYEFNIVFSHGRGVWTCWNCLGLWVTVACFLGKKRISGASN